MEFLAENKELLVVVLGLIWEIVTRRWPGAKPPSKMIHGMIGKTYELMGEVIKDRPKK